MKPDGLFSYLVDRRLPGITEEALDEVCYQLEECSIPNPLANFLRMLDLLNLLSRTIEPQRILGRVFFIRTLTDFISGGSPEVGRRIEQLAFLARVGTALEVISFPSELIQLGNWDHVDVLEKLCVHLRDHSTKPPTSFIAQFYGDYIKKCASIPADELEKKYTRYFGSTLLDVLDPTQKSLPTVLQRDPMQLVVLPLEESTIASFGLDPNSLISVAPAHKRLDYFLGPRRFFFGISFSSPIHSEDWQIRQGNISLSTPEQTREVEEDPLFDPNGSALFWVPAPFLARTDLIEYENFLNEQRTKLKSTESKSQQVKNLKSTENKNQKKPRVLGKLAARAFTPNGVSTSNKKQTVDKSRSEPQTSTNSKPDLMQVTAPQPYSESAADLSSPKPAPLSPRALHTRKTASTLRDDSIDFMSNYRLTHIEPKIEQSDDVGYAKPHGLKLGVDKKPFYVGRN